MVSKTKQLTLSSIMIALGAVLSMVKIWNMPWGGSVTLLSMLPIILVSVKFGVKRGLFVSFVYSVVQLFFGIVFDGLLGWGLTPVMLISCILLDYIIAFSALGIAGIFKAKGLKGILGGSVLAILLRFVSHVLSGVFVFASVGKLWDGFETNNTLLYSLVYNGCYMLPELIFTVLGIYFLFKSKKTSEILFNS